MTSKDPIIRVLAIGVQGLMNRAPRKSAEEVWNAIEFLSRRWSPESGHEPLSSAFIVYFMRPVREPKSRGMAAFRLLYSPSYGVWVKNPRRYGDVSFKGGTEITQKEAEAMAAKTYTFPFVVERVTDEAVRGAEWLYDNAM